MVYQPYFAFVDILLYFDLSGFVFNICSISVLYVCIKDFMFCLFVNWCGDGLEFSSCLLRFSMNFVSHLESIRSDWFIWIGWLVGKGAVELVFGEGGLFVFVVVCCCLMICGICNGKLLSISLYFGGGRNERDDDSRTLFVVSIYI